MPPTMSLDDFIKKFRAYTAGVIALGTIQPRKLLAGKYDDPQFVGQVVVDLDATTIHLLTTLYRALVPDKKPEAPKK